MSTASPPPSARVFPSDNNAILATPHRHQQRVIRLVDSCPPSTRRVTKEPLFFSLRGLRRNHHLPTTPGPLSARDAFTEPLRPGLPRPHLSHGPPTRRFPPASRRFHRRHGLPFRLDPPVSALPLEATTSLPTSLFAMVLTALTEATAYRPLPDPFNTDVASGSRPLLPSTPCTALPETCAYPSAIPTTRRLQPPLSR